MKKKAVIIGGGFGGLSCAALLAKEGWQVTLLEKQDEFGGRARSWKHQGFTFDLGPSWYLMPEVFDRFFSLFDAKRDSYYSLAPLDPYYQVFFQPGGQPVNISPDMEKNAEVFESFEPGGGDALRRYTEQAAYKYKVAMEEFLYRDYKSLKDFFNRRLVTEGLKLGIFKKLDNFVSQYVKDRRARQILEYAMVFLGTNPVDAPALYSIMSHVDLELGVYFPEGGMAGAAQGIAELCKDLGVELISDAEVTGITLKSGKAVSVESKKGNFPADVVVSGADYHHTEQDLLPPEAASYSRKYWNSRVVAPSMFIAYLGTERKLNQLSHHNLYFSEDWNSHFDTIFKQPSWPKDPCFYLSCISKTDPSSAPEGGENIFLLVPTAPDLDDSGDAREEYFSHLISHVHSVTGEDLSKDLAVKRLFTQRDFKQEYHAFRGTALGLSHTLKQTAVFRPANRSKQVENLFYTGQYVHPGVGVPMVLIASEIVVNTIRSSYGS